MTRLDLMRQQVEAALAPPAPYPSTADTTTVPIDLRGVSALLGFADRANDPVLLEEVDA